jgi:two-component system, LuxR family, sensor kinase FixL
MLQDLIHKDPPFDGALGSVQTVPMSELRQSWLFVLLGLAFFAFSQWLAFIARLPPESVPIFWPPAGVMLAFLAAVPRHRFWQLTLGLVLVSFASKAIAGVAPVLGLALTLNDGLAGVLGAWAYRSWIGKLHPASSIRTLGFFLLIVIASAFVAASLGSQAVSRAFGISTASIWHNWFEAMTMGLIVVAPLFVLLSDDTDGRPFLRFDAEILLLALALVLLVAAAQIPDWFSEPQRLAAIILIIPLLLWTAVRRTAIEASVLLSLVSMIRIFALANGWGVLRIAAIDEGTSWIMAITAVQSGAVLLLAANRSEQFLVQQQLSMQAARLKSAIEASNDGIVSINDRGVIQTFSSSAERLFGYSAAEVIGMNVKVLMPESYAVEHDGFMERYMRTGEKRIIGIGRLVTGKRKDGSEFPMELSVGEAFSGRDRIFTGFIRDVSERQQTEQRLHEMQDELLHVSRLGAMGELASALAHELNQPLTAIKNYAQTASILLKSGTGVEKLPEILVKTSEQAGRAGEIIKRLRTFVTAQHVDKSPQKVSQLIEEACALALVGARDDGVRSRIVHGQSLPEVRVDRIQIQQILINLVRNAVDAVRSSETREVTIKSCLTGPRVIIEVSDTGPGVSEDAAKNLFKPFMTTKAGGMGIGLSLSRGIAEAHGGTLTYERGPAGGAVFTLALPIGTKENA